ncbi:MAG: hypothetical protein JSS50_02910 [Proteobacteria bacterium]|nr:hypothetical protein [Pseudomonadota bacterium]
MTSAVLVQQILGAVVIGYMVVCIFMGILHAKGVKNLRQFALGYKDISTGMLVATIYATHLGAGATLGLIEQINNIGIVAVIIGLVRAGNWYISRVIFCNGVERFKDCLSQADVMKTLFGPFAFQATNVISVVHSIGVVAIQILMLGLVIQYFFGLSTATGILLGSLVVTAYSASGGIKAVILTDLMQILLFAVVLAVVFYMSVHKMVAEPDFWQLIPVSKTWIMPYDGRSTLLVMGMIVYAFIPMGPGAPFIQRILISGSDRQLQKAFSYVTFIDCIVVCVISSVAILLLPDTGEGTLDRMSLFAIARDAMNPFFIAAVILGVSAVTMSTADSWLNTGAVIATHCITTKHKMNNAQQVRAARMMTVIFGVTAAVAAWIGGSVMSLLLATESFSMPLLYIPITAGFLGYNFTEMDYKRAVITSIAAVFLGAYIEGEFGFISLLFGLIGSTVGLTWSKKWSFFRADGTPLMQSKVDMGRPIESF